MSRAAELPSEVVEAFAGKPTMPVGKLATVLGMDVKTIRKHIANDILPVHIKGTGLVRRHYVCTLADVAEFFRRTGEPCQSSRSETPRSINLTSRSKVYAFPAQRSAGMNVTLRTTRKPVAPKPKGSSQITSQPNESS